MLADSSNNSKGKENKNVSGTLLSTSMHISSCEASQRHEQQEQATQRLWAPPTAILLVSFQLECPWVQDTCSNTLEAPSVPSPLRTQWHPSTLVWCPYFILSLLIWLFLSLNHKYSCWISIGKNFIISIYSFLTYFLSLCKILYKFCFQGIC